MHCWYDLNIDTQNVFRNDYILPKREELSPTEKSIRFPKPREVFTEQWLSYIKKVGFPDIALIALFYTPSTSLEDFAHVDWLPDGSGTVSYGINITTEKNDGDMFWYEPAIDPNKSDDVVGDGNKYTFYKLAGLTQVDRCSLDNTRFTLVNTVMPHHVAAGSIDRWCFSIRFADSILPWETILNKYKSIIIPRDPKET